MDYLSPDLKPHLWLHLFSRNFQLESVLRRHCFLEIWRLHPYDKTLTTWRRQRDGSYAETVYTGGQVHPVALPGVTIDLDALFAVAGPTFDDISRPGAAANPA